MSATEANDVIDDPELSRPRKVLRRLDESSTAFFHAEAKHNYRQLCYEVLDSVITEFSDRFEPDATAVHLTNKENFLIGQREDSDYIARAYKDDANGPRLTLDRDPLIDQAVSTGQPLESFNDAVERFQRKEVFRELVLVLTNLVKIMLTLPASTCTAETSFSGLRRLKSYLRSGMKHQRFNSVVIMNVHMKETKVLSIATLMDNFVCRICSKKHYLLNLVVT